MKYKVAPYTAEITNTSRIINRGECLLASVLLSADGANGEADIYDGFGDAGQHVAKLKMTDGLSQDWSLKHPVYLRRGLYVKVNAATTYVTVVFNPTEPLNVEE